ncbi:helix-hairpin-helix domain-containing protein, partial [Haladaptatus sp. AB618]|uniref:helix-hairpin-helix domain-containing protein n=1 Tax=Haladaptatus sp. AB618 TaxID=2934173 RepID=UPI00209C2725
PEPEPEEESESEPEPEPEEESESEPEPEPEEGRPLEDVKGIGPAYAERLRNAGVENAAQLATADSAELARETDLSVKRIEGWMERAESM